MLCVAAEEDGVGPWFVDCGYDDDCLTARAVDAAGAPPAPGVKGTALGRRAIEGDGGAGRGLRGGEGRALLSLGEWR
jgi:hypothetical protein